MTYDIRYAYTSHMGKIRGNNEDNFWCWRDQLPSENTGTEGILTGSVISDDFPALAVFDGMGGESCGRWQPSWQRRRTGNIMAKTERR